MVIDDDIGREILLTAVCDILFEYWALCESSNNFRLQLFS